MSSRRALASVIHSRTGAWALRLIRNSRCDRVCGYHRGDEVRLKARRALMSALQNEGTREFLTVQQGIVEVTSFRDPTAAGTGNAGSHRADLASGIANTGHGEVVIFLSSSNRCNEERIRDQPEPVA